MKFLQAILFICVFLTQIFLFVNNAPAETIPLPTQHLILYTNDGTGAMFTEQFTNMQEFVIPQDIPQRPGYTFFGWSNQADAEIAQYQPGYYMRTSAELIELYAVWRPAQDAFILFYDANGGINAPEMQFASADSLFFTVSGQEPERPGYDFSGWSSSPDAAEAEYQAGDIFIIEAKQNVLYAIWQEQPKTCYYLYFLPDTSSPPFLQISKEQAPGQCIFQIPPDIPQRTGYIFVGWATLPNSNKAEFQPGANFVTNRPFNQLYAVWQEQPPNNYTLFFDANGGSNAPAQQTGQTADTYYTFTIPAQIPQRPGYQFSGWSENPNATSPDFQPDSEITIITEKLTLYAVWRQETKPPPELIYTLVYQANGGVSAPQTQLAKSSEPNHIFIISKQQPKRDGFDFLGWHTDPTAAYPIYRPGDHFSTNQTENVLFAIWRQTPLPEQSKYQLIYNANGGQNAPPTQTVYSSGGNCVHTLSAVIPKRDGYNFLGWAFEAYAEKPNCQPGETMITSKTKLILYAVWQPCQPPEPDLACLQQLLGQKAITLICQNTASGHAAISFPLLPESFQYNIEQNDNGNFTAYFHINPDFYLRIYNENSGNHRLIATQSNPDFRLIYAEEYAAWLKPSDFIAPSLDIICTTPQQPQTEDLPQILGTDFLVTVQCEETENTHFQHYPAKYGILPNGLKIGEVQLNEQNIYTCRLTFNAQPYIEAYQTGYGAHKLPPNASNEQYVNLTYNPQAGLWQTNNAKLPCFSVIAAPEPEPPPVYNYTLNFNANGGRKAPFPQMASSYDSVFMFVIPKEQPTYARHTFSGWSKQPDASKPDYQPGDIIILRRHAPKLTLYAVWQYNNPGQPDKPPEEQPTEPPDLPETAYCLYYDAQGGNYTPAEQVTYTSAENYTFTITAEQPEREGYVLAGWSLRPNAGQPDYLAGNKIQLFQNQPIITLYAVWQPQNAEEKPSINWIANAGNDNEETPPPNLPEPPLLHQAYIQGYQDNTIKPLANITRAEAAVMFYRLIPEQARPNAVYAIADDVQTTDWYYNALGVMQQNGLLQGYADGGMHPNQNLTRAEFTTLLVRFNAFYKFNPNLVNNQPNNPIFTDISGHWAEISITRAAAAGWLQGYPNGNFSPNQPIKRAEVVCAVNKMLQRQADLAYLAANISQNWIDNPNNAWFYADLLEAGFSHTCHVKNDSEIWLEIYPTQP